MHQFVELPNNDYDFQHHAAFSLRHGRPSFVLKCLQAANMNPWPKIARKIKGELKYHVFHANTWIIKLGAATEESHARMQTALNESWNHALGMFEEGVNEHVLIHEKIFEGEAELQKTLAGCHHTGINKSESCDP